MVTSHWPDDSLKCFLPVKHCDDTVTPSNTYGFIDCCLILGTVLWVSNPLQRNFPNNHQLTKFTFWTLLSFVLHHWRKFSTLCWRELEPISSCMSLMRTWRIVSNVHPEGLYGRCCIAAFCLDAYLVNKISKNGRLLPFCSSRGTKDWTK